MTTRSLHPRLVAAAVTLLAGADAVRVRRALGHPRDVGPSLDVDDYVTEAPVADAPLDGP